MKRLILIPLTSTILAISALSGTIAGAAEPGSPSELLEKGIYAEETKGDLDAAIALYQRLAADAKSNQRLAAQAQFRLGQCLLKKNRTAEAAAAFERLLKDFPEEKELHAKARPHLPASLVLGPVPWVDGEDLQLSIKVANGLDIGVTTYRVHSTVIDNRKVWQLSCRLFANITHSVSRVDVAADDFRPLKSRWMHSLLGDVSATYFGDRVELKTVGQDDTKTIPLDGPIYDNEQAIHLMRRLPLAADYKATIPIYSTLGGSQIPVTAEVKGTEVLETKAGKWECFKVELTTVNQTFWFSTDAHRYLVKFVGGGISAELAAITQRAPGQPVHVQDETLGIAFTTPPDWVIHQQDPDNDENRISIYLLDPEAKAQHCIIRLHTTNSIADADRKSARAWAEANLARNSKKLKGLAVRPESWKETTIGGRPAVSFIADYQENEKPMVVRNVFALGKGANSEQFTLVAKAEDFDGLQRSLEGIIASYRAK